MVLKALGKHHSHHQTQDEVELATKGYRKMKMFNESLDFVKHIFPWFFPSPLSFPFVPFILKGGRGGMCAEVKGEDEWVPIL
jgi:hypothetical protein